MRRWSAFAGVVSLVVSGCVADHLQTSPIAESSTQPVRPSPPAPSVQFREVSAQAGLTYRWLRPNKAVGNILDLIGNGCAFLDFDGDGNLDILLVGPKPALYRGDGKGRFTDVSGQMGLGRLTGHFLGCATGDFNSDGYIDVYLTAYNGGALLENQAGKAFKDITETSGITAQPWGTSASFGDLNGDGYLDLFIGNYVKFGPTTKPQLCSQKGMDTACSPRQYQPESSHLYRGNGRGGFTDITRASGFNTLSGKTLGVALADYDGSGRLSAAVANDEMPGDLMKNRGGGTFTNIARLAGTATDNEGNMHGGMGTDWGDMDADGRLDLLVGTYQNETKNVYHNEGNDLFEDKAPALGLASASPYVTFGLAAIDFDNDGYLDIVLANGHVQDNIEKIDGRTTYLQPTAFFHNDAGKQFTLINDGLDKSVTRPIMGRGLAVGDYDNDGRSDILVVDSQGTPLLLHNETPVRGHYLGITLIGAKGTQPLGAIVTIKVGGRTLLRHYHTDGSYLSASDQRLLVGLGNATQIESVTVRWPGGGTDRYANLPADRYMTIVQGKPVH